MTFVDSRHAPRRGHLETLAYLVLLISSSMLPGCWLEEAPAPPPFDCSVIDRADERFPAECGDAGVDPDASTDADAGP